MHNSKCSIVYYCLILYFSTNQIQACAGTGPIQNHSMGIIKL